jgi:hypothetical protein
LDRKVDFERLIYRKAPKTVATATAAPAAKPLLDTDDDHILPASEVEDTPAYVQESLINSYMLLKTPAVTLSQISGEVHDEIQASESAAPQ